MSPSPAELQHYVLVPLPAQGHIIPTVSLASLLAARGSHVRVTVVTTPVSAARNQASVERLRRAGLGVELHELPFPGLQHGLPEGKEALDQMVGLDMYFRWFRACWNLARPLEEYIRALPQLPVCLVADGCSPWTTPVCDRLGIPRLVLQLTMAYHMLAVHRLAAHGMYDDDDDMEEFEVPDFPVKAVGNKNTIRAHLQYPGIEKEYEDALHAEATADGIVFQTFRGIEAAFLDAYAVALGKKTFAVGPTSLASLTLTNTNLSTDGDAHILSWLDARPPESVLYVSFGTINKLAPKQLAKLAHGLESSGRPFLWAIKEDMSLLGDDGFEARVKDRGLLLHGWVPQLAILSHPAVGGFLTHCGSTGILEIVSHGVPALTWPFIAEQFCCEQLLVDVLRVGVKSGVKVPAMNLPEEAEGVQVESADIERAINELMDDGPEGDARRARARKIAVEAMAAIQEGGSSHSDLTDMMRYVSELSRKRRSLQSSTAALPSRA